MGSAKEIQEKKEFLRWYLDCSGRQARLTRQIVALREQQVSAVQDYAGMPKGSQPQDLSGYTAQLDRLTRQLDAEISAGEAYYQAICTQIRQLPNEVEQEVLERRYLFGEDWEDIAVLMRYTYRHVTRLHGQALQHFSLPGEKMSKNVLKCP